MDETLRDVPLVLCYYFLCVFAQCPECGLLLKEHTSSEHVTLFSETIPVCRFMGDIQMHCSLCAQCHAVQSTWKFAESFFWALTAPLECWLSRHKVNIFIISITINNHYNVRLPSSAKRRSTDQTSNHLKALCVVVSVCILSLQARCQHAQASTNTLHSVKVNYGF